MVDMGQKYNPEMIWLFPVESSALNQQHFLSQQKV
jgi:hypothetical protein